VPKGDTGSGGAGPSELTAKTLRRDKAFDERATSRLKLLIACSNLHGFGHLLRGKYMAAPQGVQRRPRRGRRTGGGVHCSRRYRRWPWWLRCGVAQTRRARVRNSWASCNCSRIRNPALAGEKFAPVDPSLGFVVGRVQAVVDGKEKALSASTFTFNPFDVFLWTDATGQFERPGA